MYKLVALDLDGTLLSDNKKISFADIHTINLLIDNSVEVVIATGRRYSSAKELVKSINKGIPIFACNGGVARFSDSDKLVMAKTMDEALYLSLIKIAIENKFNPIVQVNSYDEGYDMVYIEDGVTDYELKYFEKVERYRKAIDLEKLWELDRVLGLVFVNADDRINKLEKAFKLAIRSRIQMHKLENLKSIPAMLEVTSVGCNKWDSIYEYAIGRGIKASEILAIGDDANDISMLQNAGNSYAMANAIESAKLSANNVTSKTNNESGVSEAIYKAFKGEISNGE